MNDKIDRLFKNLPLSRRDFLKYTGTATSLFLAGHWLKSLPTLSANGLPRVVSIHDSSATNWDYITGYHWEYVDQNVVNNMVAQGVMALTGETNTVSAWNALIPYQPGESVLIKFNFNNCEHCGTGSGNTGNDHNIDPLAETANAIIDGLTSIGVPGDRIWITDPSRTVSDRFRNGVINPNIQYYGALACIDPNYHMVNYVDPSSPDASTATCPAGERILPAQVFVDADHLINIPILKSHGSYVTLALKNHYGSVLFENYDLYGMHSFFDQGGNILGCDLNITNILADINNNPHIRDKTRLIIGEGLYGNAYTNWQDTERWNIFGNDDPNILFLSTDPVAISSVMTDYIMAERGWQDHYQLHAAANLNLGVHDHWDSFQMKQYSLIDYINMDADTVSRSDIDQKIKDFKEGQATEEEIKDMVNAHMEDS
jgi:hypothetical protein